MPCSEAIQELFSTYGVVESVNLIKDRETGAITVLDDRDLDSRHLRVNLAKPREERQPGRGTT
jgi:hypothetical protein